MIEMWMVYQYLKSYFNSVVKIENFELTDEETSQFYAKADCNSQSAWTLITYPLSDITFKKTYCVLFF